MTQQKTSDVQREYLGAARRMVERRGATDEESQVLALWEEGLVGLETGSDSLLEWCDWALKQSLNDVDSRHGLYLRAEAAGSVRRMCVEGRIEEAVKRPPQTSRARLRGELIRWAKQHRRDYTVGWSHLKLQDHAQRTVLCRDPFACDDDRVQWMLDAAGPPMRPT